MGRGKPITRILWRLGAPNFEKLKNRCKRIDEELIYRLRNELPSLTDEEASRYHRNLLERRLTSKNNPKISLEDIYELFMYSSNNVVNRPNESDLRVLISEDLNRIIFKSDNIGDLVIQNPELLWDCNVHTSSRSNHISNCKIHSKNEAGTKIEKLFQEGTVLINYDQINVYWIDEDEFWPPSIDTLLMVNNLKSEGLLNKNISTVLDIGAGTGFIGLWLAHHNPNVKKLFLSEWLLTPLLYSIANARNLEENPSFDVEPLLGIYGKWPNNHKIWDNYPVDVLVCNPPYLPVPNWKEEHWLSKAVSGTDLMEFVIQNGFNYANEIFTAWSDLALEEAKNVASQAGVNFLQIGQEYNVPFRIPKVLEDRNWIEFLKDRGLEEKENCYHQFYHTVRTYKLVKI